MAKHDKSAALPHAIVNLSAANGVIMVISRAMCCKSGCGSCAVLLLLECGLYGAKGAGWCFVWATKLLKLLWHLC